jgi:para-nitrobenzyl esterase
VIPNRPEVDSPAGRVRGVWRGGSAAFLGIPFAQAPVGPLRFARPMRAVRWEDVLDAANYGSTAQRRSPFAEPTIPEPSIPGPATLNVNVFTPVPGSVDAHLPVMVWIHGGGFVAGSPASPWYDGRAFNRDGIVTVTVSYRLGFEGFGWLADAPQNRGLRDVICALEWVRENIGSFGGDPDHVTIAGQSSGGGIVLALLASPRAQGLFRSAIAASPVPSLTPADQHLLDAVALATVLGASATRSSMQQQDELRVLRVQETLRLETSPTAPPHPHCSSLERAFRLGRIDLMFGPSVDGEILIDPSGGSWATSSTPLLIGATRDEFVVPDGQRTGPEQVCAWLHISSGGAIASACADPVDPVGRVASEVFFRGPARDVADARAGRGGPTWLYEFSTASPVSGTAGHCLDLPYWWDLLDAEGVRRTLGPHPSRELASSMHQAWVDHIRDGEPGWAPAGSQGHGRRFVEVGPPTDADETLPRFDLVVGNPFRRRGARSGPLFST